MYKEDTRVINAWASVDDLATKEDIEEMSEELLNFIGLTPNPTWVDLDNLWSILINENDVDCIENLPGLIPAIDEGSGDKRFLTTMDYKHHRWDVTAEYYYFKEVTLRLYVVECVVED